MKPQLPRFSRSVITMNAATARLPPSSLSLPLLETEKAQTQLPCSVVVGDSWDFADAHQLFDVRSSWDVVSATAVLSSFVSQGRHGDTVHLFSRLLQLDLRPNQFTFGTTVHAATALREVNIGRQLHALVTKMGFQSDVFVGSSLLDHYAKLGSILEAEDTFTAIRTPNVVAYTALISGFLKHGRFEGAARLFRDMPERNVVSWNAMIGGCSQMGLNEVSVNLFVEMTREGTKPNHSTFPCILNAAANMAALGMGRSIHASCIKHLGKIDIYVGNSLISFYAKCGSLEDGILVFDWLLERNVISWNAVIWGYAHDGRGSEALEFYGRMQAAGLKPNGVTLLGLLSACNHAGMVEEGYACFQRARSEDPGMLRPEHYACMVDLLSRFGRLVEAQKFLEEELPFDPGLGFWKAMLGGCQVHANKEWAEAVARHIQAMDPRDASSYVLLSNVYSATDNWQRASRVRQEMKERGVKRIPGCSWIEVSNGGVHVFHNGDRMHDQADEIYAVLDSCLNN